MKNMKKGINLTKGNESEVMLKFAIPMIIGNMFQQLYNYAFREKIESYSKEVDHLTGEIKKERTYEYQPSVEDSIKAISTLGDWLGYDKINNDLIREKMEAEIELIKKKVAEGSTNHNVEINIVDPWTEEDADDDEED